MRTDFYSSNIIGKGEDSAVLILESILNIPRKQTKDFYKREVGIYTQVPLVDLLYSNYLYNLAEYHQKGSIDIVVITRTDMICIRVQGRSHYGQGPKPLRDKVQKNMLIGSNKTVIDFPYYEMPELFKDKINEKSIKEVKAVLRMNGIKWKES